MGIAPLPEEPFGPADTDEAWNSPLASKQPRESAGHEAFEEELEGGDGPYGSLVMLRPKTFKKKPVLTVDPEELEKAYQAFDVCGAQIMEGDDAPPIARHGTQFLGLAPIEEGEEAIESDDDVVADDDLDRLLQDALESEDNVDIEEGEDSAVPDNAEYEAAPEAPTMPAPEPDAAWEAELSAESAPPEEPASEPVSEAARPSFSLPEFRSEPEEENDAPRGDGWSLVPPKDEPDEAMHDFADEPEDEPETENDYSTTHYYEDEEQVFDPFADAQPRRLANVQATGARSQLRARLLREEQAEAEPEKPKFSFFGWLRGLFG